MEVDEVQSRTGSASMVHGDGQSMSAAQTIASAAAAGSTGSVFYRRIPMFITPPPFVIPTVYYPGWGII